MTLGRLWAFLAVALPVLAALLAGLSSVDLTYHVRAGTQLLDTGAIPTTDTWTYTAAGAPWLNQQWAAQLVLGAVYRVAGWTGLAVLRATLVGLTFGFLFEACRRSGLDLRRAAWLTIAAFCVAAVALALRPQLFGMALLTATLLLVVDRREHSARLWVVPVLVLAWANLHGSFFLGSMVLGLACLQDLHDRSPQARRTLLILVVSVVAACVTPFGPRVWLYAAGLTTNAFITSQITEWQPTSLRTIPGVIFFASVAVVVALLARRGRATPWPTLVGLAAFAAIGAYAIRGMAWWPLGAVVLIAPLLRPAPDRDPVGAAERPTRPERTSRLNVAVVAIIALAGIALLPLWRGLDSGLQAPAGLVVDAPSRLTAELRTFVRPGTKILNPQPWGSWFEFALPDALEAVDSRIEVIPAEVWTTWGTIRSGGPDWQALLDRSGTDVVVTDHVETAFAARLLAAGWNRVYEDEDGAIFVRAAVGLGPSRLQPVYRTGTRRQSARVPGGRHSGWETFSLVPSTRLGHRPTL
jgi:hypothetical protein